MSAAPLQNQIEYPHILGKPHWRRTLAVYAALDNAPSDTTYPQLLKWVKQATGKKCSRKLISKWKEERHLKSVNSYQLTVNSDELSVNSDQLLALSAVEVSVNSEQLTIETQPSVISQSPISYGIESQKAISLEDYQQIQPQSIPQSPITKQPRWFKRLTTAGVIALSLVGLSWILTPENKNAEEAVADSTTVTQTVKSPIPTKKKQSLIPHEIKIQLTIERPQDLKVKPGDTVIPGQPLSERVAERQRLESQKRQLQLSLQTLAIPLPEIAPPKSISPIHPLPPDNYQEEQANIALKQQGLKDTETAITNQRSKIGQLQLLVNQDSPEKSEQIAPNSETTSPFLAIIEHEQAVLKQLQSARDKANRQLDITTSQLVKAKQQRAQAEYQRYLEATKRAIAIQQQQIEWERSRSLRAGQLQEREYSKATINTKIQEIDNALSQLSTVKAPYSGKVKKIKWKGQSDHTLTVELTLAVTSEQPAVTSQQ